MKKKRWRVPATYEPANPHWDIDGLKVGISALLEKRKAGHCPRCGHKMWYSAKRRHSKCAECGLRLMHFVYVGG